MATKDFLDRQSGSRSVSPATDPPGKHCLIDICWDEYGVTDTDMSASGRYGYGRTQLGVVMYYFELKLNGAQSISKPVLFVSNRGVRNLIISGERLYCSSKYPGGAPVDGGKTLSPYGPHSPAANQKVYWVPNGYKSYENTVAVATIAHQFTWQDPSFPGTWFFYVKSIKFAKQSGGGYKFESVGSLPSSPDAGGDNP